MRTSRTKPAPRLPSAVRSVSSGSCLPWSRGCETIHDCSGAAGVARVRFRNDRQGTVGRSGFASELPFVLDSQPTRSFHLSRSRRPGLNPIPDPSGRRCRSSARSSRQTGRRARSRPLGRVLADPRPVPRVGSRCGGRAVGGIGLMLGLVLRAFRPVRRARALARERRSSLPGAADQRSNRRTRMRRPIRTAGSRPVSIQLRTVCGLTFSSSAIS